MVESRTSAPPAGSCDLAVAGGWGRGVWFAVWRVRSDEGERALMEGEGRGKRRRKEEAVSGAPGEGDSEVEKFFALLRRVGEMRQLQRRADDGGAAGKEPKVEYGVVAWTPTFQWEDFAVVAGSDGACATRDAGGLEKGTYKGEEEGSGLDLRLSL